MKNWIFLFLLFTRPAVAYIENRGLFPIGESEALMSNTGVALSGSSGAALFNPAGLARLKQNKLSLTGNTYMQYSSEMKPMLNYDGQDLDFRVSGTQAIPSSFISVWNKEPWTVAFTVTVPEFTRSSSISHYDTTNYDLQIAQMTDLQFMMLGLSVGTQLDDIDVGAGCFVGNYVNNNSVTLVADPKPTSGAATAEISTNYRRVDVKNLICHAGVQKDWSETTRWGVSLRLPSAHLGGDAEHSLFIQDNTGAHQSSGLQKKKARYDIPMDVSFGVANTSLPSTTILADISYQMKQTYTEIEDIDSPTENKGVFRYNFGIRHQFRDHLSFVGGYSYNPSSLVLKESGDMKEDYQSFSLGAESRQGPANLGIAVFQAFSRGESFLPDSRRSSIQSRATAIVLTTGFLY